MNIIKKIKKIIMKMDEKIYRNIYGNTKCSNKKAECNGQCWLNVAGSYTAFEIIAPRCKGTHKEKEIIEDVFHEFDKSKAESLCKVFRIGGWRKKYIKEEGIRG